MRAWRALHMIRTILFDLDGTLADTAPDLAYALNTLLQERGKASLPYETIRPVASHGAAGLIELGFGIARDAPRFTPLRERFISIYRAHLTRETRLFPGMPVLLDQLTARGLNWGIVTNKPAFLTDPLIEQLGLREDAVCVVSGDTTGNRKPHPEPMLHACQLAGSKPDECLYVGDAARDIEAGNAAGMQTLVALFGYIGAQDHPETWGANGLIRAPEEILDWLG
jgi:N-acetyl-D-muramate 6-phosphate phosphatase